MTVCRCSYIISARLSVGVWTSGQRACVSHSPHVSLRDTSSGKLQQPTGEEVKKADLVKGCATMVRTFWGNDFSCYSQDASTTPLRQSLFSLSSFFSTVLSSSSLSLRQRFTMFSLLPGPIRGERSENQREEAQCGQCYPANE